MMDTGGPVQFNPLLPEVIDDPYPLYRWLRTQDPEHQTLLAM